jgi:hypothetical protein
MNVADTNAHRRQVATQQNLKLPSQKGFFAISICVTHNAIKKQFLTYHYARPRKNRLRGMGRP